MSALDGAYPAAAIIRAENDNFAKCRKQALEMADTTPLGWQQYKEQQHLED